MGRDVMPPPGKPDTVGHRRRLARMFGRIARRYDLFNDIISFGLHRLARNTFMRYFGPAEGSLVLDICAGTGVLAEMAAGRGAQVVLLDASIEMLQVARDRGMEAPMVVGDALDLPFADDTFDAAMVGFGLRSMASLPRLFAEIVRVVKAGGRVGCLDFTRPRGLMRPAFAAYLHVVIRGMARIADPEAYSFLAHSVERVIDAEAVAEIMQRAGLENIRIVRLAFGTLACWVADVAAKPRCSVANS